MTYFVIDTHTPPAKQTRVEAENLKKDLIRDNPKAQWEVVTTVDFNTESPFEQLYTLAASMLEMTGANPMTLGLEISHVDGTVTHVSALSIMHNARQWLDATPT